MERTDLHSNAPYLVIKCKDSDEWLRKRLIGGSSAAVCMGLNPYKNKKDLYLELTSPYKGTSSISNAATEYGHAAEPLMRKIFRLDHPEYEVFDPDDEHPEILQSDLYPFMTASLDGIIVEKQSGRKGIYECKTCLITNSNIKIEWNGQVPNHYYCQILHYFIVTGYSFAILHAKLKFESTDATTGVKKVYSQIREYYFDRNDPQIQADMNTLIAAEKDFYDNYLSKGICPPDGIIISDDLL